MPRNRAEEEAVKYSIILFELLTYRVAALTRSSMRSFRSLPVAELPKVL